MSSGYGTEKTVNTGIHLKNHHAKPGMVRRLVDTPSFLVAVTGAWLVAAPLLLDHHLAATAFASWNDVLVGTTLAVLAAIRVIRPAGTAALSLLNSGLGVWLIAAPFVGNYTTALYATLNDMIVGLLVIMFAGVSWFVGRNPRC
jgi:hypothetical protein